MRASTSSWSWIDFGAYPGCLDPQASVEEQLGIAAARVVIADLGAEKKSRAVIYIVLPDGPKYCQYRLRRVEPRMYRVTRTTQRSLIEQRCLVRVFGVQRGDPALTA